ncbi:MAG: hypothetical protein OHK0039_12420 [Bacteroidia bacterium]
MNKWIVSLLLLFGATALTAQTDTLSDVESVSEVRRVSTVAIDRFGTDRKINDGFAVFGDPISALIFYAPKIGEDVLISIAGNSRPDETFFEQPPFTVTYSYAAAEEVPFGKAFKITAGTDSRLLLSYDSKVSIPLREEVSFEGGTLTVAPKGYDAATETYTVEVVYRGPRPEIVESFRFQTPPVAYGADPSGQEVLLLTYRKVEPVASDGTLIADHFTFTIKQNSSSPYNFGPGDAYLFKVTEVYFLPIVIIVLLLGAIFFTVYFKFVNFRFFKLALDVVRGKYSDPKEAGEVSHFQALTAALSGTVGLGNIAGVAIAISVGGPGATFWMILAGLLGMSSKFVECTLGVKYRNIDARGEVSGGPMYYISQGFSNRGMGVLGKIFAGFFAIMCIGGSFGGGNMFQVNQAFQQVAGLSFVQGTWLADNGWMFGVVMALIVAAVIIGGIRSIASVTDKIVPFMCGVYVLAALVIIIMNISNLPLIFGEIISGAFAPRAVAGGFIGVLIHGFRRAAFSNEAGVGSASIAHSAVKTNNPASEGIVALLEPFIDTVIVCTMTALVIIITDNHLDPSATDGVALTSRAFSSEIPFFKYVLSVAVILFAFSTMISWSYYGLKSWTYLFGNSKASGITYKILFCLFVVVGAAASLGSITDFSDAMIFAMAFPNVIGLVIMAPEVRKDLDNYIGKIRRGEIVRVGK